VKVVKQFREVFAPAAPPAPLQPVRTHKNRPAPSAGINLGDLLGTLGLVGVGAVLATRLVRYVMSEPAPALPAAARAIETVPLSMPDGTVIYTPVTELPSR